MLNAAASTNAKRRKGCCIWSWTWRGSRCWCPSAHPRWAPPRICASSWGARATWAPARPGLRHPGGAAMSSAFVAPCGHGGPTSASSNEQRYLLHLFRWGSFVDLATTTTGFYWGLRFCSVGCALSCIPLQLLSSPLRFLWRVSKFGKGESAVKRGAYGNDERRAVAAASAWSFAAA
jgi:hypothetical protein